MTDLYLLAALSVVGLVDVWLDRETGRGLIARAEDWVREYFRKWRVM